MNNSNKTVDERVVSMKFENKDFEKNVKTSLSTLDKLKQSLSFKNATKGLENVNSAVKNVDMSELNEGIQTVNARFSALQVVAITALSRITNAAITTGSRLVSALTIDPIKSGLQEYETQINAVQTILANTSSKGTTLDQVNSALDELNYYADKTIYNFTEMTRNIGTFTAAGVDLETSVNAIQGIANLAAVSGSTSMQASTAMYQLSQALATGTIRLMDWNSVVNAGMGGQIFQDALKETSKELKTGAEAAIKAKGSFRESLQTGWLTSKVLTETLKKFTTSGANEYVAKYTGLTQKAVEASLKSAEAQYGEADAIKYASKELAKKSGKNAKEIEEVLQFAKTAEDAATKVKTFTQLIDTLKEALQSGWTQSWEYIIGDFEEAKTLWTGISDTLNDIIQKSSDARNKVLGEWSKGGGRDALIAGGSNLFKSITSIVTPIKGAFDEVFPSITSKQLIDITNNFKKFTEQIQLSETQIKNIKDTFKGLFSILNLGKKAITAVVTPIFSLLTGGAVTSAADGILSVTAALGRFFTAIDQGTESIGVFKSLNETTSSLFGGISNGIGTALNAVKEFTGGLSHAREVVGDFANAVENKLIKAYNWIKENITIGDIFAGFVGYSTLQTAKSVSSFFDGFSDKLSNGLSDITDIFKHFLGIGEKGDLKESVATFKTVLGDVHDSLQSFTEGIKVASFVGIATAITLLTSSIRKLSEINSVKIGTSLVAIKLMIKELNTGFSSLIKTIQGNNTKGLLKSAAALIALTKAVDILASAMTKLGDLSWDELIKGLAGAGTSIYALSKSIKYITNTNISLKTSVALLALAESCEKLSDAVSKFGKMSWEELSKGLTGMGAALTEFTLVIKQLGKVSGKNSLSGAASVLIMAQSLDEISEALESISKLSWEEISRGLYGIGGALTELGTVSGILGKKAGLKGLAGAGTIVLAVQSLDEISEALESISKLSWEEITEGLYGIGGALTELGTVSGVVGKLSGLKSLAGAGAIVLAAESLDEISEALESIGQLSWDQISRGLNGMGGALTELGAVSGIVGKLTGLKGVIGASTIVLASKSLKNISDNLESIGQLSWDQIKIGLTGMGGALAELGVISGATGYLTGLAGLVGAGTIVLAAQSLDEIANALAKFGSMSWDEIEKGINAMGGALTATALGGFLNTFSLLGSISTAIAAKPLNDLADAVSKFAEIDADGASKGINTMLNALGLLSAGTFLNSLSILGSISVAVVAEPLGALADSVKKWIDIKIPDNLANNMSSLAGAITSFTLSGLGSLSISTVAEPLGVLADSIKKWSDVKLPDNLNEQLGSIASGVRSFSWLFTGSYSLSTIAEPLGALADSIKKWSNVKVSATIGTDLGAIATGIQSFTAGFITGWLMDSVAEPLGALADSVKKWSDVKVPTDLKTGLKDIAAGVSEFTLMGALKLSGIADPINKLAEAFKAIASVGNTDTSGLPKFATNVQETGEKLNDFDTSQIHIVKNAIDKLVAMMKEINETNVSNVDKFIKTANNLNNIKIDGISVNTKGLESAVTAVRSTMVSISSTISSKNTSISAAMSTAFSGTSKAISGYTDNLSKAATSLITNIIKAVKAEKGNVSDAFKYSVSGVVTAIKSYYISIFEAGEHIGNGLVAGINSKQKAAYAAGYALGQKSTQGVKDGAAEKSPSKLTIKYGKYVGEGLIIGMNAMEKAVNASGFAMGQNATESVSNAISKITDIINSDIDTQPTIRPVIDLSDVNASVDSINSLFSSADPSVSVLSRVGSISSTMDRNQNRASNDDVVYAINGLKHSLDNVSGDTYQINGVTYDDGSNISSAVETLINAAIVERRR